MVGSLLKRLIGAAVVAGGAAVASAGVRYAAGKRMNASERLAEALLDTARLTEALRYSEAEPEAALAACAAYLLNTTYVAAEGVTTIPAVDPVGYERTAGSPGLSATAKVITTAHEPEMRWQFEVEIPGVGRATGSRRLLRSRFTGLQNCMRTPDTLSVRLDNGYTANIETDLEFANSLVALPGRNPSLFGTAALSDNRGNVGRLRIEPSGEVSGTVTRGTEIVGRFEGSLAGGMSFRQYLAR
ncbi:MAG: hypothetical protein ACP5VE_10190 [Chthonomonadales bacterium]